ncbi:MAG: SRPBCC family protein [Alphaproteobacteria bacterium]
MSEKNNAGGKGPFVISRTYDAPRDVMWRLWTDCAHLKHWWGPKGFKIGTCRMDLRPGGTFLYSMVAPDGSEMWGKWVFREINAPHSMTVLVSFSDKDAGITRHPMAPTWPRQNLSTMTMEEKDGKTTVTVRWTAYEATKEEQDTFDAGHDSMRQGFTGTFDQLEAYIESI